ncbi:MAG: class I SAM-dependent methyltransferase [Thermoplasmata archaeon]|nr:class I SAM-dependent methyltransferase [Thermoplasmata archaeon]
MNREEAPDTAWVGALAGVSSRSASRAVREAQGEEELFRHLAGEHRRGGRSFYVEIEAPLELFALTRLLRPRHVVEVGVSSGVSSAYLLQALDRNARGTLHSVDLPQRQRPGAPAPRASWTLPPGRSTGWAVPESLKGRWDLRIGDKAKVLPLLAEELPRVDLFLYDVPHADPSAFREFVTIDRRFHRGSVAIVDHGGTHELCPSLRRWATRRGATARGRTNLGLFGFRCR